MTRLIWVIVFAVLVGALLLFFARSYKGGIGINRRLAEIEQAREILSRDFPEARLTIQAASPIAGIRNLVVTIDPGNADSTAHEQLAATAVAVVQQRVTLSGYDSLVIVIAGRPVMTLPVVSPRR